MDCSTKYPSSPVIYKQLGMPLEVDTVGAEIGFLRTLISVHAQLARAGNISNDGRLGLLKILKELNSIEHLLEDKE